ncbi:hypothetical protein TTHERM_000558089 (macronuclear) [Tetrahymena thermophila SB210]|uniref:Uncharacterized protein n=1 Tax=Tetrahymena thermophila (strain SB210) TaxID=312017 RepID=W7X8K9_TETTS|nr:hypothetical protein TTHERM_000558089 [Tetrahymena thermophila SB210]EWS72743.1 hypothetical protein TTHERM_000558089 [Tetrahymena thermophila SB210]|eukprot:XP_012654721.1 hypothetical protein TTHERM_000558089 [Tetrahymena thermophila SB210]
MNQRKILRQYYQVQKYQKSIFLISDEYLLNTLIILEHKKTNEKRQVGSFLCALQCKKEKNLWTSTIFSKQLMEQKQINILEF